METTRVKEALKTAIMLGNAARSPHTVEIDCIGTVQIENGYAALMSEAGEWKRITRENMNQRLEELMSESLSEQIRRKIKVMLFT